MYLDAQRGKYSKRKDYIIYIWVNKGRQRPAVAIFDRNSPGNVVSKDVADWFGPEVPPIQKETRTLGQHTTKDVQGEIYLGWKSEETPEKHHEGIFYVSTEKNPNYDVILGTVSTKALQESTEVTRGKKSQ